jgi:hypothetical protein
VRPRNKEQGTGSREQGERMNRMNRMKRREG